MFSALDRFLTEVQQRFSGMQELNDLFGFLNPLALLRHDDFEDRMTAFKCRYGDEIDCAELTTEIRRIRRLHKVSGNSFHENGEDVQGDTSLDVLRWLVKHHLQDSVPYLVLSIRIYLTITVSIASCERCFSKLKIIKNYLRSTMLEDRLSSLSLISIENKYIDKLDLDAIITEFATVKARRARIK